MSASDDSRSESGPVALQRTRAALADERFRLLVESVRDYAIFMLDSTGHVLSWNEGARRIKGYEADEIIGWHFSIFYPPEDVGKCPAELEIATAEGRFEEEGWRVRKDGQRFFASVTITLLRDQSGDIVGFAKVTRDLTERLVAQARVQKLIAEKAVLTEKARVHEFQERFLGVLGHDLRNPLASIDMGITLLRQRAQIDGNEATRRVLVRMGSSVVRMVRMIDQILDLTRSRLGGGIEIYPTNADLMSVVQSVVDELVIAYPGRTVTLRSSGATAGRWDTDRLGQVLSNLIGNAIVYGDPTFPITIEVVSTDALVEVRVHNRGEPIPADILPRLFDPFRRGDRESRRMHTQGLGLGLYISRELAIAHGGDLEVRSTVDEGTTFTLRLPRAIVPARSSPALGST